MGRGFEWERMRDGVVAGGGILELLQGWLCWVVAGRNVQVWIWIGGEKLERAPYFPVVAGAVWGVIEGL